jgi:DNA polymerase III delta' subunit
MPAINWPHCAGQQHIKQNIEAAIANGTLGHAYLFSGMEGSGKFAAALDCALILLCEDKSNRPCMTCASCKKVLHYAHPDFHVIMPVVLQEGDKKENALTEAGWNHIAEKVKERIQNVYSLPDHAKVPILPVDWVREINHTILRGIVEGNANVVIIDGVDSLNKDSANNMLKLLEEPPAGTVLLLLTDRPAAVLPTIVSRCQIMRFSYLSPEEIRSQLCNRFSLDPSDPRLDAVIHTGSLGRSLHLWGDPATDKVRNEAMIFWDLCTRKNWQELAECIDRLCEESNYTFYERLFMELTQRIRNAFLRELDGTENLFLGDRSCTVDLAGQTSYAQAERLIDLCERSIAAVKARGNITLVVAYFAIALTEALHGEKQQSG